MLDVFGDWNNAYGRGGGFAQYQFIVPTGNEPEFIRLIEHIQASGTSASSTSSNCSATATARR